ncbi:hypothetical protein Amet_4559 [Alkaliphilus metalliredigens QYMF]|uniref:Uncharacterized protein n=2 Tax=Alkaliphilus TaxID=114627 RepID=A6TWR2_ALKMQ|nr:hypothetical protein Amet_4559 [Alkaliphilus metalliredigens QYMF]
MILIRGLLIILIIRYLSINIKRLKACNVFVQSRLISWILVLLTTYLMISGITDSLIKGDSSIKFYIEVIFCGWIAYGLIYDTLHKLEIKVENIYKAQLENLLEDVFNKRNLILIKEESDEEKTIFLFLDQHIESRVAINPSMLSTKRHRLIIEHKNDIPNLEEIVEDMDAMISPMSKDTVLIKFFFKTVLLAYIAWKFIQLFN